MKVFSFTLNGNAPNMKSRINDDDSPFGISSKDIEATESFNKCFHVSSSDLADLSNNRDAGSRSSMITLFQAFVNNFKTTADDAENPLASKRDKAVIENLVFLLENDEEVERTVDADNMTSEQKETMEKNIELAATALTIVLNSCPEKGINTQEEDLQSRKEVFGENIIAEKKTTPFIVLCWEAMQDFVLIALIVMGVMSIVVETTIGLEEGEKCGHCWIEGFAILVSVCIVVFVTAGIDYMKQFAFRKLSRSLMDRNTKSVIRNGEVKVVTDADIVVGDILCVNSHSLATIPADCVLLGPVMSLKMDESSLTGESYPITKAPGDIILCKLLYLYSKRV